MADQQIGNMLGVAASHTGSGTQKTNLTGSNISPQNGLDDIDVNADSIANLRARLAAVNGTYFTATRLNAMTFNDLVYALRLADFPSTIK
jgi:hypothetical protein